MSVMRIHSKTPKKNNGEEDQFIRHNQTIQRSYSLEHRVNLEINGFALPAQHRKLKLILLSIVIPSESR
jgi:hypothetical protein